MTPKALLLGLALLPQSTHACTTVHVNATKDKATVIGRTMELSLPLPKEATNEFWSVVTVPRGSEISGAPDASPYGYAAVGGALKNWSAPFLLSEGMNEEGLTVSTQTLHLARYANATGAANELMFGDVAAYLLGSCAAVGDVEKALGKVSVVDDAGFAALIGRMHWSVADASGAAVVVEYLPRTGLQIHDNSRIGVVTNDPGYEFQLQNLNQYADYPYAANQAVWAQPVDTVIGPVPAPHGHGLNTRHLPSGSTPPDRFVKMFLLRETAARNAPPKTVADAVVLAQSLLNTVHLVKGTVARVSTVDNFEWTNWCVVKVPAERRFLVRTYSDLGWRQVDLTKLDFDETYAPVPLYDGIGEIRDMTPSR